MELTSSEEREREMATNGMAGNIVSPASPVRRALRRQPSYNLQGTLRPQREGSIFEAFFVVGVDPNVVKKKHPQQSYPPSILYTYPADVDASLFPSVSNFCFPHGIETQFLKRTKSLSIENSILYASVASLQEKNRSFVVMLTGEHHLYYGLCVIDVEFVKTMPSFIDPSASGYSFLNKSHDKPATTLDSLMDHVGTLFGQNTSIGALGISGLLRDTARSHTKLCARTAAVAPRCYLMISKFPFFQLHFDVLYRLLANEHLFRITRDTSSADHSKGILEIYHNTSVPRGVDSIDVQIPGEADPITFACPPGSEDQLLVQYCMSCTFGLLNLNIILTLLSALLQEEQVIFVSKNISVLSAVILSLIPLLRPFTWQGLFIPILPNSLSECIDAPVPFIIGVEELSAKSISRLSAITFDIDANNFIGRPPQLSQIPNVKELISKIGNLKEFPFDKVGRNKCLLHPYKSTPIQKMEVFRITQIVNQWNMEKFHNNVQEAIGKSNINKEIFDIAKEEHVDAVVKQFPSESQEFYQKLLLSQMFSFYFDKQLSQHINKSVSEELTQLTARGTLNLEEKKDISDSI